MKNSENMLKKKIHNLYMKIIMLWVSSSIIPIVISILYIILIRYLFIKLHGVTIETDNITAIIKEVEHSEQVNNSTKENKIYASSNTYYSYFPTNDESLDSVIPKTHPGSLIPVSIEPYSDEYIRVFRVDNNSEIPPVQVTNPPVIDNSLPFEIPVNITVPEPTPDELIIFHNTSDIQKDIFHSIYAPSYEGKNFNYNTFDLHIQIRNIVADAISRENVDVLNQQEMVEIVKKEVKKYMINYNIYADLSRQSLQNTNHLLNLIISEMMINSLICEGTEQVLLHTICRALIFETLFYIEGTADWNDPYIQYILSRFLHFNE